MQSGRGEGYRAQRRVTLVVELAVGEVAPPEEVPHIAVRPVQDWVEAQERWVISLGLGFGVGSLVQRDII